MNNNKTNKTKIIPIILLSVIIIIIGIFGIKIFSNKNKTIKIDENIIILTSYEELFVDDDLSYKDTFIDSLYELEEVINYYNIEESIDYNNFDFENNKYLVSILSYDSCSENILGTPNVNTIENNITLEYMIENKCGSCAFEIKLYLIPFNKNDALDFAEVKYEYNYITDAECDDDFLYEDKPIIYIYPTKKMDLKVELLNSKALTSTYPKYSNYWDITVDVNGNIHDKKTNRNYYALYWEGIDNTKPNMTEGFIIKGKDTISFLEEKLEYLGLNEREINEFIVYWLPKMENNKYNFIRFKTIEEINEYMPLKFSVTPDTLIRVLMDFKPLDKKIKVKEQKLIKKERSGFTIVEWGGREIKEN